MSAARNSRWRSVVTCFASLVVFPACADTTPRIFASASLTAVLETALADADVDLHFAGTPRLVFQLQEGAKADVFVSADRENMRRVVSRELGVGAPRVFARNRLAIATERGNPKAIRGIRDLARSDLRIALCAPDVPAGRYARRALAAARVTVRSTSDEPSVQALLAKIRLGELDAGIVYATDVSNAHQAIDSVAIDAKYNVTAEYVAVALRGSTDGTRILDLLFRAPVQRALHDFGFELP